MKYNEKVALLAQEIVIVLATLRKENKPLAPHVVRGALAGRPYIKKLLFSSNNDALFSPSGEFHTPSETAYPPGVKAPSSGDSSQVRASDSMTWTIEYKSALQRILSHFIGFEKTPTSHRVGLLIEKLSGDIPAEEVQKLEEQVFNTLADFIRDIEKERGKLFDLLHELARELIMTERAFLTSLVNGDKSRRHTDAQFDERVTGYVSEIENSISEESSINRIRELVLNKLGAIRQSIVDRRVAEEDRTREFEARISHLESSLEESHREINHIQHKAEEDHLTGMLNRKALDRIFAERLAEFGRSEAETAFIMLDIDHFKEVNDRCGHLNGDKVLIALSARLKASVRKTDFVFRYAGDEFVVLLPDTDLNGALRVADLFRQVMSKMEFLHKGSPIPITVSLGVTVFKKGDLMEDIVHRSDEALYEAKQEGGDTVRVMT